MCRSETKIMIGFDLCLGHNGNDYADHLSFLIYRSENSSPICVTFTCSNTRYERWNVKAERRSYQIIFSLFKKKKNIMHHPCTRHHSEHSARAHMSFPRMTRLPYKLIFRRWKHPHHNAGPHGGGGEVNTPGRQHSTSSGTYRDFIINYFLKNVPVRALYFVHLFQPQSPPARERSEEKFSLGSSSQLRVV